MLIAEVGHDADGDRLYKVTYDGTLYDERGFTAIGGQSEALSEKIGESYKRHADHRRSIVDGCRGVSCDRGSRDRRMGSRRVGTRGGSSDIPSARASRTRRHLIPPTFGYVALP